MTLQSNLRINADRLWDSIHAMAEIGPGIAGGSNRQTVTDEDGEGRRLFQKWCEEAGLTMGVDQMGTMFMRREGTDPDVLDQLFGVLVTDFSTHATRLHCSAAATTAQRTRALDLIRQPVADQARFERVVERVRAIAGTYEMTP